MLELVLEIFSFQSMCLLISHSTFKQDKQYNTYFIQLRTETWLENITKQNEQVDKIQNLAVRLLAD